MRTRTSVALALALSGAILMGATALTVAAPAKKAPAKKAPAKAAAGSVAKGKTIYAKSGCAMCHVVKGQGSKSGPDLSHIGKTWNAKKLTTAIREPKKIKPTGYMPAYPKAKISDPDLKSLVAYLSSLK